MNNRIMRYSGIGLVTGAAFGMVIGSIFELENVGTGLIFGAMAGIVFGPAVGLIKNKLDK
jgi:uncharacterized membrane protein